MLDESHARARALAAWKSRVLDAWKDVHIDSVESDESVAELGVAREVSAVVSLGALTDDDVAVQLIHGPVGTNDELTSTAVVAMDLRELGDSAGHYRYRGSFSCEQAGRYGYTVRVVPAHPDLRDPGEMGSVAWA